jgi:hypothetical protein
VLLLFSAEDQLSNRVASADTKMQLPHNYHATVIPYDINDAAALRRDIDIKIYAIKMQTTAYKRGFKKCRQAMNSI